ncbi:MAG: YgaP family membrane protein [Desulfohalobiaceae bacterium]
MELRSFLVLERWRAGIYGAAVFLTIALALTHSPWWLLPNALIGVNFLQYAVTGWCPVGFVLKRTGFR